MALTAVIPKSSPDLRLPIYAYKVVGLRDIFTVPLQGERIVLSRLPGEGVRVQVQHSHQFWVGLGL